jgi:hypothetical protein
MYENIELSGGKGIETRQRLCYNCDSGCENLIVKIEVATVDSVESRVQWNYSRVLITNDLIL